jgi:hypothetical protein
VLRAGPEVLVGRSQKIRDGCSRQLDRIHVEVRRGLLRLLGLDVGELDR